MLSLEKVVQHEPNNIEEWRVPVKFVKQITKKRMQKGEVSNKYEALEKDDEEYPEDQKKQVVR